MFTCSSTQIHTECLLKRLRAVLRLSGGEETTERERIKYCCVMLESVAFFTFKSGGIQ